MELPGVNLKVGVIMGSRSDWAGQMEHCCQQLEDLGIENIARIVSAHRTPALVAEFAAQAEACGIQVIIACAGGAAHLPGMVAAHTWLPVIGVPAKSSTLNGVDSTLSIQQMPAGIPVNTMAIGKAGAINAALAAAAILGLNDETIRQALIRFRTKQTQDVIDNPDPRAQK